MIYLPFIYYFLGPVSPLVFITYFLFYFKKIKLKNKHISVIALLFVHFIHLIFINRFPESSNIIRYYWGFFFLYLYFENTKVVFSKKILLFLIIATIVEAGLINSLIKASSLPNFPNEDDAWSHFAVSGSYQRPYGFGGNATILSVSIVLFLFVVNFSRIEKLLLYLSVILVASGTGVMALAVYFINYFKWYFKLIFLSISSIIVFSGIFKKVSFEYIQEIYLYKIYQISNEFSINSLIWGTNSKSAERQLGGDFSFLSFLEYNGLIGLSIFIVIVLLNVNSNNRKPLLLITLCSLHYGVVFSMPGQLLFAYFLSVKTADNLALK